MLGREGESARWRAARSLRSVRCSSRCTVGAGAVMLTPDPGARSRTSPVSHLILFALATVNTKEFGPPSTQSEIGMGLESGVPHSQSPTSHFQIPIADGSQHSLVISSLSYPVFVRFF